VLLLIFFFFMYIEPYAIALQAAAIGSHN